jgi:hypothetical protein
LTKSAWEETAGDGGAVKTWPATGTASGDDPTGAETRVPESALSTLPKNSPAIRFETDVSIRWPTPPIIPPTTASASQATLVVPSSCDENATFTVAPIVPGAPAPSSFITSDAGSVRSESTHVPAYVPLIAATPAVTVMS